ncbi:MAG: ATP-dependent RecD-like DNA helicase [Lachnospiraceae bacterium]|nr:ATP-dependent RecD-like DNA helicase [Lachnospiraceae bacterium]
MDFFDHDTTTLKGHVRRIYFEKHETGYKAVLIATGDEDETVVGKMPDVSVGDTIEVAGSYVDHPKFGIQFKVSSYKIIPPTDSQAMERYLASGAVAGVGEKLAAKIVGKFGDDTFRIIEEEPERLSEIKGISKRKAMEIAVSMEEKKDLRDAMVAMNSLGISQSIAVKIYDNYGPGYIEVIRSNPYKLAEDIRGIGFKTADDIASAQGMDPASEERSQAGILYALLDSSGEGHCYLPADRLIRLSEELLGPEHGDIKRSLDELIHSGKVKRDEDRIYLPGFYFAELTCARMLVEKNIPMIRNLPGLDEKIDRDVRKIAEESGMRVDPFQIGAVRECVKNGLFILTGGPGTGKTTTINMIIGYFLKQGLDIVLAAPTGRAAKRMTEATGYEATTIHRLLGVTGIPDSNGGTVVFQKNADDPLEADVIIIDEMSMVDIMLFKALLSAVPVSSRLILVGDASQLPSVGPGCVLNDICSCDFFPGVRLEKIFRQDETSSIVINAHKIDKGEHIELSSSIKDFIFLERDDPVVIRQTIGWMISEKLPDYVHCGPFDIQVLTPGKKSALGVAEMNRFLQQVLNPPSGDKKEYIYGDTLFREGDKVMQTKNDYKLEWHTDEMLTSLSQSGMGVFNGDLGKIRSIDENSRIITVLFDDGRVARYSFSDLDELDLSYAMTIHKSQGSEYPAVIIPVLDPSPLLVYRNLLYTGITRARSCVVLLGSSETINRMIDTKGSNDRYSSFAQRLNQAYGR